jgi:hypothetical protein
VLVQKDGFQGGPSFVDGYEVFAPIVRRAAVGPVDGHWDLDDALRTGLGVKLPSGSSVVPFGPFCTQRSESNLLAIHSFRPFVRASLSGLHQHVEPEFSGNIHAQEIINKLSVGRGSVGVYEDGSRGVSAVCEVQDIPMGPQKTRKSAGVQ